MGVDELDGCAVRQRLDRSGERVDGEVALREVGGDVAAQAGDVDDAHGSFVEDDAGGVTLCIERDEVSAQAAGERASYFVRVTRDGKVEIGQPLIKGASVKAEVVKQARGEKVIANRHTSSLLSRCRESSTGTITTSAAPTP